MKPLFLVLCSILLAACASTAGPLEYVPPSFLDKHPVGTQNRDYYEVLQRLDDYWIGVSRLWDESRKHRGGTCYVFVLRPDGSVFTVEELSSDLEDPDFQRRFLEMAHHFTFGPASGTGNYVFAVSYDSRRRWVPYCEAVA